VAFTAFDTCGPLYINRTKKPALLGTRILLGTRHNRFANGGIVLYLLLCSSQTRQSYIMTREEQRFAPEDVILSPVEERDLKAIAEGYYAAFTSDWHDMIEPPQNRPPMEVRVDRFAKRMKPWLSSPDGKWVKATLAKNPNQVIGHAGWLIPRPHHVLHHWRKDAAEKLGWREKEGLSSEEEEELWAHVDVDKWQGVFVGFDDVREELMRDEPHWFLAPLWVHPSYQKRGLSTLLMKDVLDIADAQDPPIPVYLEAVPEARAIYEHSGFEPVKDKEAQMIRRGPKKPRVLIE